MGITVISYDVQDIGKHVKKSKRRFFWRFTIDGEEHSVELQVSYLSGKKKVSLDDRSLYEGQKVMSTSFQFPFSIGSNMCNIVQHGEHFELRINNQVFSHLYDQVKMKREFVYEGDGGYKGGDNDDYSNKDEKPYQPKSSYQGYGSDTNKYQGSSYSSGTYKSSYGAETSNKEREESPSNANYYSRSKAWDDVKKAQNKVKETKSYPKESNDDEPGFSKTFEKFSIDEKPSKYSNKPKEDPFDTYKNSYSNDPSTKSSNKGASGFDDAFGSFDTKKTNDNAFDSFNSKPSTTNTKKSGFDDFGDFGKPQPKANKNDGFSGFDNFSGFSGFSQRSSNQSTNKQTGGDLLGVDFGTSSTSNTNNNGFGGFSNNTQTNTKPVNNSDLLSLDFGTSNTSTTNTNFKQNNQGGDLLGGDLFGSTQSQQPNQLQSKPTTQTTTLTTTQTTQSKPDPWSSLISLDVNELNNTKGGQQQQQQQIGGFNNQFGGNMGTNNMYGGGNFNSNQYGGGFGGNNLNTGYGGNNFGSNLYGGNQGGFGGNQGGFGGNQGGYGGNQGGFGGNQGGFGGNQGGFGGNNLGGGFGGNNGGNLNNGGFGNNFGGNTGGFSGSGFQSTNTNNKATTQQTPFDF